MFWRSALNIHVCYTRTLLKTGQAVQRSSPCGNLYAVDERHTKTGDSQKKPAPSALPRHKIPRAVPVTPPLWPSRALGHLPAQRCLPLSTLLCSCRLPAASRRLASHAGALVLVAKVLYVWPFLQSPFLCPTSRVQDCLPCLRPAVGWRAARQAPIPCPGSPQSSALSLHCCLREEGFSFV